MRRGFPNTTSHRGAPFPCLGHYFGCVSRSTGGLFRAHPVSRDAKISQLHVLCRKLCIAWPQEVHGSELSRIMQESGTLRSHVFLTSGFLRDGQAVGDTGG